MTDGIDSIDTLFVDTDTSVRETFDRIMGSVAAVGPVSEELREDTIHLAHSVAFASIHPRQRHLILSLRLDHSVEGVRIHRSEQVSADRWHAEFRLSHPDDFDDELHDLLVEAMELV